MTAGTRSGRGAGSELFPVSDVVCVLGEGPTWDAEAGVVRWVDIDRGVLYEADVRDGSGAGHDGVGAGHGGSGAGHGGSGAGHCRVGPTRTVLTVDGTLGAAVHAEGGGFLLATQRHLEHRDASGATVATWELIPAGQQGRLNDGKCDPDGRFVVGSIPLGGLPADGRAGVEQLWRLEHDGTVTELDAELALSNGMAWSPDGQVMYNVDTMRHRVYSRPYDSVSGDVGAAFVLIDTGTALPDGLTVDSVGDLWIAMWGDGEIRRFAPDGTPSKALRTGARHTTSCAFVGAGLDLLVVTSAARDDVPSDSEAEAFDGRLLARRGLGTGLPTRAWRPCTEGVPR